jgi:hypothetical protein
VDGRRVREDDVSSSSRPYSTERSSNRIDSVSASASMRSMTPLSPFQTSLS